MERRVEKNDPLTGALKKISYGFYILTTGKSSGQEGGGTLAAGLVSWVTQCSFDPPMVSVAVQKTSDLGSAIKKNGAFGINVLGKADLPMISPFSKDTEVTPGRLNGYAYQEGPQTGVPVLKSVPAFLECKVKQVIDSEADHFIVLGEVVHAEDTNPEAEPLVEWETEYHYGG